MKYFPGHYDNRSTTRHGRSPSYSNYLRNFRFRYGTEAGSVKKVAKYVVALLACIQLPLLLYFHRGGDRGRLEYSPEQPESDVLTRMMSRDVGRLEGATYDRTPPIRMMQPMQNVGLLRKLTNQVYSPTNYSGTESFVTSIDAPTQVKSTMPRCPMTPPNLFGRLEFKFNTTPPSFEHTTLHNQNLHPGGSYFPEGCVPRHRVAIIIPHRSREVHLKALMWHLHPILQRQQIYYKVYVIQQAYNLAFNKAKLMNIGYLEAMKEDLYDCVVFHDVDLLPEDDRLLYHCTDTPKHLSVAIDKYGYRLPYPSLFGGVTMLSKDQFRDVNGYSNMFWGWGGEDDDMFARIFSRGYTIKRPPFHQAKYRMSYHERDKGNKLNLLRYEILSNTVTRMLHDGVNSVKYSIVSVHPTPLFTNITADVGTAILQCKPRLSTWSCGFVFWVCQNLGLSCGMLQFNSTDDGTLNIRDFGMQT
nr:beta-1,4-galactosyltransferase 2 isoform X1 [Ciona intestinalis]XP_018666899.1 beta-1,4-galactosyltransferase 2 isoform X2 [Ciona intestinalis]|eukprot:XP_009858040.1 beta-1,4-galactosyltransferase 2 isoform X1 [Ciona intestinalis]